MSPLCSAASSYHVQWMGQRAGAGTDRVTQRGSPRTSCRQCKASTRTRTSADSTPQQSLREQIRHPGKNAGWDDRRNASGRKQLGSQLEVAKKTFESSAKDCESTDEPIGSRLSQCCGASGSSQVTVCAVCDVLSFLVNAQLQLWCSRAKWTTDVISRSITVG